MPALLLALAARWWTDGGLGGAFGQWFIGAIGGVVALVALETHTVRVTVDRRGLAVAWGPFGVPVNRVAIERVAVASAIVVRPGEWGGWGYRGGLRLMGKAAAVVTGGPGIRLDLTDGRVFVVTVDDADTGAALINDYVARAADAASV